MSNFKIDNEAILNVEYKYDVQMPQIDIIPEEAELIETDTQKIYNVTLPLSDLGLSSTKTITLTTILEKE
jgi:acyl carrier protein